MLLSALSIVSHRFLSNLFGCHPKAKPRADVFKAAFQILFDSIKRNVIYSVITKCHSIYLSLFFAKISFLETFFRSMKTFFQCPPEASHNFLYDLLVASFALTLLQQSLFSSSLSLFSSHFFAFSPWDITVPLINLMDLLITCRLCHPNIVQLLETYEDKTKVYLIMEL